jgi:hypothetical protein
VASSGIKQEQPRTEDVQPSQTAIAYAKYIMQLARPASLAAAAAQEQSALCKATATITTTTSNSNSSGKRSQSSSAAQSEAVEEATQSILRLLAHAYALHTQQQCLGTRIGTAATDALGLMGAAASWGIKATAVFMDYPDHVTEPMQQLIIATDTAGRLLGPAGRQAMMDELPKALVKATMVLGPLATA